MFAEGIWKPITSSNSTFGLSMISKTRKLHNQQQFLVF